MSQEDKYPDKIFVKNNLTVQEKLLFANSYIKELKKEISELNFKIGVIESEKQELIHQANNTKQLIENKKGDLKEFRKDEYIKQLATESNLYKKESDKLKHENRKLTDKIISLNKKSNIFGTNI